MATERAAKVALVIAGLCAIAALTWHHMAIVGDGFWTIAAGRWVLAHRALPTGDPFAFGSTGEWTVISLGACVLFAKITDAVGLRGLEVFGAAIEALAVGLVWIRSTRTSLARVALLPLALFYVVVDAEDLSARGQVLGDLLLVLLFGALARVREDKRVHPALYFVMVAVWTNLHLSFLAAFFLPLLAAVLVVLESRKQARAYVVLAGVAALAMCVNPYGPRYLAIALRTAFETSTVSLDLFRSPDFHDVAWLVGPALAMVLLTALGRRGDLVRSAFLLFVVVAACRSRRFATALVAVEIGITGPMLDELTQRWKKRESALAFVTAGLALGLGAWGFAHEGWSRKDPLRDVPSRGAVVARAGHDVAAPLHWGGYLAYEWMGQPRYFIDGRDHVSLFGNGSFEDSIELWMGTERAFEVLDVYGIDTVLWERDSLLDGMLRQNPAWHLEMKGPIEVVYVRTRR